MIPNFSPRAAMFRSACGVATLVGTFVVIGIAHSEPSSATKSAPAPAIRLNSIGYLPDAQKRATIAAGGDVFVIFDLATGKEAFRGQLSSSEKDGNGVPLWIADFSELDRRGEYRIQVDGREPISFRVADDLYNWPFYCAARAMYLWRCGTAVAGDFGGDHFHHAACHLDDAYLNHAGGPAGKRVDGTGGWHDAGDYNKYTVNAAFTVGMMLHAWQHFDKKLASLSLDIPESENEVPDYLDEVRWELEWLLKMQADDGRVYHKLSTLNFCEYILPEKEDARRYYSPWGTAATADFAAVMAQTARLFRPFDENFAQKCLAAAEKSNAFLRANPDDHRPDISAFETGPYQSPDSDDRIWAAAELWETTGQDDYLRDFEQRISKLLDGAENPAVVEVNWDWATVRNLGVFTYVLSQRQGRDAALLARVRDDAIGSADAIVEAARRHPYGRTLGSTYYWGCNGTVARQSMNLHVAHLLTGEPQYRAAMLDAINHLLGRNPFGRSYITGVGARPPRHPHDRRSVADDVASPWPGYLVGGPWPKPTDWYDDYEDYRTNEIAINWNGALLYALAAFVEPQTFEASVAAGRLAAVDSAPK